MAIVYRYGENLYINLTNACTNACVFCIRKGNTGLGGYNLWLGEEPSPEDVFQAVDNEEKFGEAVFCGFGEPLVRPYRVLEISRGLKKRGWPVRVNTNGHAELISSYDIVSDLSQVIDAISVSLNAQDNPTYQKISNPVFGEKAYPALLDFSRKAVNKIPDVTLSVVEHPLVDIEECRKKAEKLGAKFRVR